MKLLLLSLALLGCSNASNSASSVNTIEFGKREAMEPIIESDTSVDSESSITLAKREAGDDRPCGRFCDDDGICTWRPCFSGQGELPPFPLNCACDEFGKCRGNCKREARVEEAGDPIIESDTSVYKREAEGTSVERCTCGGNGCEECVNESCRPVSSCSQSGKFKPCFPFCDRKREARQPNSNTASSENVIEFGKREAGEEREDRETCNCTKAGWCTKCVNARCSYISSCNGWGWGKREVEDREPIIESDTSVDKREASEESLRSTRCICTGVKGCNCDRT